MTTGDYVAVVLTAAAVYEAGALSTDRYPTISEYVWRSRRRRWLTPALWVGWAWLTYHFWIEVH